MIEKRVNWSDIVWAVLLLSLPISSFTPLSKLVGGTHVAPFAIVPLALLCLFFVLPRLFRERQWPVQFKSIFIFLAIAVLASALSYFREVPSFRNISLLKNQFEAFLTLAMGLAFYLTTIYCVRDESALYRSIRWINIGALLIFVFCLVQAFSWKLMGAYPQWMWDLQGFLSASKVLYPNRVTGLALEPSWLAHMLNVLYIPLWLGFVLKRVSAYRLRIFKVFILEDLLLLAGMASLYLSYSRIGWLGSIVLFYFIFVRLCSELLNKLIEKYEVKKHIHLSDADKRKTRILFWLLLCVLLVLVLFLAAVFFSKVDPRMKDFFNLDRLKRFGILGWASKVMLAERMIYWISGFKVFLQNPWLGVGLGVVGYYFQQTVIPFGYMLPEIYSVMSNLSFVPNAKNLWVRLLAETGIFGTIFYVTWIYRHWKDASALETIRDERTASIMGLVGKLVVLAFVMEGFSMDTFGLPYAWISFGLLTASWRIYAPGTKKSADLSS